METVYLIELIDYSHTEGAIKDWSYSFVINETPKNLTFERLLTIVQHRLKKEKHCGAQYFYDFIGTYIPLKKSKTSLYHDDAVIEQNDSDRVILNFEDYRFRVYIQKIDAALYHGD